MGDLYDTGSFILHRHGGRDDLNHQVPGSDTILKGHFDEKQRRTVDKAGQTVMARGTINTTPDLTITTEDRITIRGKKWEIIGIDHPQDFHRGRTVIYIV